MRLSFVGCFQECPHEPFGGSSYELTKDARTSSALITQHLDIPEGELTLIVVTTLFPHSLLSAEVLLGNSLMAWCSPYPLVVQLAQPDALRRAVGAAWIHVQYSAAADRGRQRGSISVIANSLTQKSGPFHRTHGRPTISTSGAATRSTIAC